MKQESETTELKAKSNTKYVIWCSRQTNFISTYDLQEATAPKTFKGIQLHSDFEDDTYVQSIHGTDLLISLHHAADSNCANFGIYSLSKQKLLLTFEGAEGEVGAGDLSINSNRKIAALLPIQGEISYHLFDATSMEVVKKAKWHPGFENFNAEGTKISLIDKKINIIISKVDNNEFLQQYTAESTSWYNRCRWNPIASSPIVAIKYDKKKLTMIDLESSTQTLSALLELEADPYSIDWRCDGNLLLLGDRNSNPKIYDLRAGEIVKIYKDFQSGIAWTVKWSSDGELLGIGLENGEAHVVDFRCDRVLYTGTTTDKRN